MIIVDSVKYHDSALKNYRIYDYGTLFRRTKKVKKVSPVGKPSKLFFFALPQFLRKIRSVFRVNKDLRTSVKTLRTSVKTLRFVILPSLFILMLSYRMLVFLLKIAESSGARLRRAFPRSKKVEYSFASQKTRRKWLWSTPSGRLLQRLSHLFLSLKGINDFLDRLEPDLIILPEDNIETLSVIFVTRGRARNIPTIIIPFTIPNPLEPAKYYFDDPLYHVGGVFSWLLAHWFPKWRFRYGGCDLLRQPAIKALCHEMLGLSSPAPWVLNRGAAFAVALDSEAQREAYLKLGFPAEQLRVIGDLNSGMFDRVLRDKAQTVANYCDRHGLKPDRPLILCGFPPDQYQGANTERFEFSSYDKLLEAWMESFRLLSEHANVVIRPHPRIPLDRFDQVDVGNVKISWEPTADLIPLCDLYVASISATIRWAIACGIPVINYDTFRYRYGDYESAPGVVSVEGLEEFRSCMTRFVTDGNFAADLRERQRSVMSYWGAVDEDAEGRLSALVLEAVAGAGRLSPSKEKHGS